MKLKNLACIFCIIILSACGSPMGDVKDFGNLEIFYSKDIQENYVDELGQFFQTHNLIHPNKKHSVKLTSNQNSFVLKMIVDPNLKEIPADKKKEIIFLERALDTTVFKNINFVIEITDAYFNPVNLY